MAVSIPEQQAAVQAVQQICTGLPAIVAPVKPVDARRLEFYGVPPGGIKLV